MVNLRIELPIARVHGIPAYWPAIEVKWQVRYQMILRHLTIAIFDLFVTWVGRGVTKDDPLGFARDKY